MALTPTPNRRVRDTRANVGHQPANAVRQGADVLVTGDVRYHDAQIAESLGVGIIDAGHFATEHIMVPKLGDTLASLAAGRNMDIEILPLVGEKDPFHLV